MMSAVFESSISVCCSAFLFVGAVETSGGSSESETSSSDDDEGPVAKKPKQCPSPFNVGKELEKMAAPKM